METLRLTKWKHCCASPLRFKGLKDINAEHEKRESKAQERKEHNITGIGTLHPTKLGQNAEHFKPKLPAFKKFV